MRRTLVVGYDGGLGKYVSHHMDKETEVVQGTFNVQNDKDIHGFMKFQQAIDNVVYCAGVNKISLFENVTADDWYESMDVNCYGFVRLIQIMLEKHKLNDSSRVCIVTSNAANIAMSHSISYNCSKAAANMAIRQMAREIPVTQMMIFGVAPNKLAGTPMSLEIEKKVCEMRGWTSEEAEAYQLAALPAGVETHPRDLALFIVNLMQTSNWPYLHGTIIPYGGPV